MNLSYSFQELDKEKLLHIAKLAAGNLYWKDALNALVTYCRPFFIFDNVVIYLNEIFSPRLDVLFARATGRGKSKEADVSWGETIANRVVSSKQVIIESISEDISSDRLRKPILMGIPLVVSRDVTGALVFVRFGGPAYEEKSIEFTQYLAWQVSAIIRQKLMDEYEKELEKQRSSALLQGDFINNLTHELRSPLGFIRGYATTLLREDANWDDATQHQFLEIIERETRNLTVLIDDLLESSRLQSGTVYFDFSPVNIATIIKNEVHRAQAAYPNMVVVLDIPGKLPLLNADARRLAQVFENLLGNSHKHAPLAEVYINVKPVKDYLLIDYYDTGPGIEADHLPLIFERFYRIPDKTHSTHGAGLGLSICKQIIEIHNGVITANSSPGKGLQFNIKLPLTMNASVNMER